ncbi:MAG: PPC domain-containing protein [Candidatus Hydrogenedentota bacterium]
MTIVICLLATDFASAVNPSLSTVLPRGGQRGTDVEVTFHGGNLADAQDVFFHDDGISLKEVKAAAAGTFTCVISIAPDARLGNHRVRVRTATGISKLILFSVGNLAEVTEVEPNSTSAEAQVIVMNSTVNGTITSEDVDYFTVDVAANSRLAVEVEALRLGDTLFDSKVRLFSPHGHELVAEDDTALMQQDPSFVFDVTEAGKYVIALSESAYGGNGSCRYRIHIGDFPRPLAVTPMGITKGSPVELTWLGDSSIGKQTLTLDDVPLGMSSVLPESEKGLAPSPVPFRVSEYPGVLEVEPNANKDEATLGTVPGAFDGVIQEAGDIDHYAFEGKKGQVFNVRVWAREMGSPLDSVMALHAPSGGQILHNDDGKGLDSYGRITLPEDGRYDLYVHDQLKRGGAAYAYRVELTPIKPALRTYITKSEVASAIVPKGNRMVMYVGVGRSDFSSSVQLTIDNLPAGVVATYAEVANGQSEVPVLLTAAPDAVLAANRVAINGVGKNGETVIEGTFFQQLPVVLGRNKIVIMDTDLREVALAVTDAAPFSINFIPPKTPVIQSSVKDIKVVVTRNEGFTKPIKVTIPLYPPGFAGGTLNIPEGQSEGTFRIEAKGNAPLGESRLLAVATSEGYSVATEFTPINVEAPWLTIAMEELRLEQGKNVEVPITFTHTKEYPGEYELSMRRLPKGVTVKNQVLKHGVEKLVYPLTIAADAPAGKHGVIGFAVDIQVDGEIVSHRFNGKSLTVFKPLPPALKKPPPPPEPEKKKDEPPKPKRRTRFPETQ